MEKTCKVTFDRVGDVAEDIEGFGGRTHRLQTPGHDPLIGLAALPPHLGAAPGLSGVWTRALVGSNRTSLWPSDGGAGGGDNGSRIGHRGVVPQEP